MSLSPSSPSQLVAAAVVFALALSACAADTTSDAVPQTGPSSTAETATSEPMIDDQESAQEPVEQPASDEPSEDTPEELAAIEVADDAGLSEADDIVGCTRLDAETIELDIVNNSPATSSYWLTVAYFDDAGQRVADTTEFVNHVRPGERTIEQSFVFEAEGTTCEVIDVDRTGAESDPGEVAEVSSCDIVGEDVFGDVEATVVATNGTDEASDYDVTVAFLDADGVRRGTGTAWIEVVRPGESAPSDVFTVVPYHEGYRCDVVAVDRSAS